MKSKTLIFILILFGCSQGDDGIKPKLTSLTESVYASVTVQPKDLYSVFPSVAGILDSLHVEENDTLAIDQIIARIISLNPELTRENARLNLELAESKYQGQTNILGTIEQEIDLAKSQLKIDSLNYIRQKNLWDQNIGSQSEFETRKLKYQQGLNNLELLKQRYKQTKDELRNSYIISKNSLKQANSNLSDYTLRSRINGKVYEILKEEGEFVTSQSVIAKIGQRDDFILEMQIDEVDIARLEIGQRAIITLDAYPKETFEAAITKIYPFKNERTQTFTIEGVFDTKPKALYAGLAGEANIIIQERDNVLTIPAEYLLEGNEVKTENGLVKVTTGLSNLERVEITSGLDSTITILKP